MPVQNFYRARARAQLNRPSFGGSLDDLLGVSGGPLSGVRSGNIVTRGAGDRVLSDAEVAGQRTAGLSADQQSAVQQFLNPTLSGQQEAHIGGIARRAVGQGLIGGAVNSPLQRLQTGYLAQNRAAAFDPVNQIVQGGLASARAGTAGFFNTAGNFLGAGFGQNLSQIAPQTLQALSAVGLGADAIAAIAQRQGVYTGGGGDASSAAGQGFLQFLAPQLEQGQASQTGFGRRALGLGGGGALNTRLRAGILGRNRRIGGQAVAGQILSRLQGLSAGAAQFQGIGQAIGALSQGGFEQARTVLDADVGGVRGLLAGLGYGDVPGGTPSRSSALFRQIGFA